MVLFVTISKDHQIQQGFSEVCFKDYIYTIPIYTHTQTYISLPNPNKAQDREVAYPSSYTITSDQNSKKRTQKKLQAYGILLYWLTAQALVVTGLHNLLNQEQLSSTVCDDIGEVSDSTLRISANEPDL